ncbi:uncharacterized protein AMSG_12459 [Thecamonas trahens ATCC 50062]|uniref:Uncharacterized protein n=1 Tax=Thecamonas trahens ATCC 50062 TaxID=461836 RepID=A0A0L0DV89_THETB|nr:hypothetical protein AMSG_12459 [Thecamonas trahens ATCC 50062]KNC56224.1 hypothetical protein AMSG_12459 [Thecamonas trahens ATCC 50062]|eukprot:XP_013752652.1 hypothetical protein AMSG_12459 [Thecamonas trahens ATCC 50062]
MAAYVGPLKEELEAADKDKNVQGWPKWGMPVTDGESLMAQRANIISKLSDLGAEEGQFLHRTLARPRYGAEEETRIDLAVDEDGLVRAGQDSIAGRGISVHYASLVKEGDVKDALVRKHALLIKQSVFEQVKLQKVKGNKQTERVARHDAMVKKNVVDYLKEVDAAFGDRGTRQFWLGICCVRPIPTGSPPLLSCCQCAPTERREGDCFTVKPDPVNKGGAYDDVPGAWEHHLVTPVHNMSQLTTDLFGFAYGPNDDNSGWEPCLYGALALQAGAGAPVFKMYRPPKAPQVLVDAHYVLREYFEFLVRNDENDVAFLVLDELERLEGQEWDESRGEPCLPPSAVVLLEQGVVFGCFDPMRTDVEALRMLAFRSAPGVLLYSSAPLVSPRARRCHPSHEEMRAAVCRALEAVDPDEWSEGAAAAAEVLRSSPSVSFAAAAASTLVTVAGLGDAREFIVSALEDDERLARLVLNAVADTCASEAKATPRSLGAVVPYVPPMAELEHDALLVNIVPVTCAAAPEWADRYDTFVPDFYHVMRPVQRRAGAALQVLYVDNHRLAVGETLLLRTAIDADERTQYLDALASIPLFRWTRSHSAVGVRPGNDLGDQFFLLFSDSAALLDIATSAARRKFSSALAPTLARYRLRLDSSHEEVKVD